MDKTARQRHCTKILMKIKMNTTTGVFEHVPCYINRLCNRFCYINSLADFYLSRLTIKNEMFLSA